jgi:hypothetical protein
MTISLQLNVLRKALCFSEKGAKDLDFFDTLANLL